MIARTEVAAAFQSAIEHPANGVVGLVDDILRLCQENDFQLDWTPQCWRIRPVAGGPEQVLDEPHRKSVFRGVLARLAALCNERNAGSVSPYGGQGRLSITDDPASLFQVSFMNTPEQQWLKLSPIRSMPLNLDNHVENKPDRPTATNLPLKGG